MDESDYRSFPRWNESSLKSDINAYDKMQGHDINTIILAYNM